MIEKERMVRILADVHMAEAQVEHALVYPDTALMTFNHQQQLILDKHGVSQEEFRDTYRYYLVNVKEMDALYETIIDTLSVREAKIRASKGLPAAEQRDQPAEAEAYQ
ncbi:MAG: DUF4296 domain-containing protein [Hymenobacteraceae bacterium]|nr:DUF4296 domain-containing protein [Hymenobacteraceae bacterium]MDX5482422.1 DUF4296 domain-containing protein [Hymenobacteraceae bacterium]